jgi:hypothetical protein
MDPEIPELGPGPEPVNSAVRGADYTVFIEKEQAGAAVRSFRLLPPYSIGIYSTARKFPPYSRVRVWAGPTKKGISANVLFPMQKIQAGCIIGKNSGYTKIRRKIRQQKIPKTDSRFLHIELLSREAWTSKDTKFFTPSTPPCVPFGTRRFQQLTCTD